MSAPLVSATLHTGAVHAATLFLSKPKDGDSGGQGEDFGKSTPLGLLLLVLFLIAVAFLIRSMSKHLKRVPQSFTDDTKDTDESDDTDESGTDGNGPADTRDAPQAPRDDATGEPGEDRSDESPRATP